MPAAQSAVLIHRGEGQFFKGKLTQVPQRCINGKFPRLHVSKQRLQALWIHAPTVPPARQSDSGEIQVSHVGRDLSRRPMESAG